MKPEFPTNGVNSAVSCKISSKEGCSVSDSRTNNEELDEFSTKINNFFEIHNSFLYEDVLESASDLETYLSTDSTSDVKINGNCSHEDETVEDEKLKSNRKKYGLDLLSEGGNINVQSAKKSLGNHHLSPFEIVKIPAIPDSFQLPISNETQNTVTFDVFSSENNFIDIKFPTFNSSGLSQDLTKAQRSVRLNKKSNLKKMIKKSTDEKLTVPYKTKECLSPKNVISRDVAEKSKLENVTPVHHNLEINSSLGDYCDLSEDKQKYHRGIQSVNDPRNPRVILEDIFKMQHNNENEAYVEKARFKLSSKSRKKLQPEEKTMSKKNAGKTSKKVLNSGKNLKKNKALPFEDKNNLNETNGSVKAKDKTFTPDRNSFSNQSKLSIKSTKIAEESLSKKSKLRIGKNSVKEVAEKVSLKKKIASRKKSFPQNISKIETKFDKKNTPKNKAALEKGDILNENNVTDLPVNEIGSDLINNKIIANKNLNTKTKAKKTASKKKVVLENEDNLDDNDIIDDAALHAKESRNNLCKDVVANDKIFNTKIEIKKSTRKKKNALENNEDILNKNKIVENTNLTINEIGKDLMKNKVVAADKHLNTKIKRKNTAKKKSALEKEVILNKNNITESINLPVNEIESGLIKNKTVADDQNQKSKSMQLYKTITPVSQNSSVRNIFNSLNKNTTNTALSGTPQRNSSFIQNTTNTALSGTPQRNSSFIQNTTNTALSGTPQRNSSFIQLFNKVIESGSSETFSKSNNSFAKLFEQRSSSKFAAISKITKEFNQKQGEEQLLQPNSSKESNINLANLKSVEAAKEKSVKITPLGKKRSNEDNTEVTPLKKKKQNQDSVKRNSDKNLNGEVSSNEDSDEHYNDKITKTTRKQLVQSIVSKPSRRSSKRNQKLDGESNVTSDLCNQEKRKYVKNNVEDVKSLAKSHSSCNPASVVQTSSKRNSRTKNSTKIESVDAQSSHKTKGKADSLLSTESESIYSDERFDACSLIKVIEVKSLANLNEKKNTNVRMQKSNSFVSDSFSEDSKAMEKSEKQLQLSVSNSGQNNRRKNKRLHLTQDENSCATQSEENTSIELNSADRLTRTKRKRRSTTVNPDFCYEVKTQRIRKEDKSFSDHKNGIESPIVRKSPSKLMRCKETDFINEISNNDTTQEEDANEHAAPDGEQFCNLNSNGVPMNSWNSEQSTDFLSSYTLYPLNSPQCRIMYDAEQNSTMLCVPIQCPLNLYLPPVTPSMITNDNMSGTPFQVTQSYPLQSFPISPFISSTQSPMLSLTMKTTQQSSSSVNSHPATSVVSDQNVPSLIANKNILSKQKPQTISSAVNSKNASVTSSKEISCNSYSNNFVNNVHPMRISPSKAARSVEALQASSILLKHESELCINWESILERSFALIDIGFIDKLSTNAFGKKLDHFTVKEFCSNPVVVQELSKQLERASARYDPQKIDYYFYDSILDEPFTQVLKDVVYFLLRHIPERTLKLPGSELRVHICEEIYSTFSLQLGMLFSDMMPEVIGSFTLDKMAGVLCLISIIYIFYHCKKKIEM